MIGPITREIIASSPAEFYDEQVTHLGLALENFHFLAWAYWVHKFECLLCRLSWLMRRFIRAAACIMRIAPGSTMAPALCSMISRCGPPQAGERPATRRSGFAAAYLAAGGNLGAVRASLGAFGDEESDFRMIRRICHEPIRLQKEDW